MIHNNFQIKQLPSDITFPISFSFLLLILENCIRLVPSKLGTLGLVPFNS